MNEIELLKTLRELMPVGNRGYMPSENDWETLRNFTGRLPPDYRLFFETYGAGLIGREMYCFIPGDPDGRCDFLQRSRYIIDSMTALKESDEDRYDSFVFFPQEEGLLPFGATYSGSYLAWSTRGKPRFWNIVVFDVHGEIFEYDGSFCEFLIDQIIDDVCEILPENYLGHPPITWEPFRY